MSISTFLENTKAQMKSAVSTHPIAIFLISAFAIGIWFMELGTQKGDHLAYWVFEPMLFIFVYLKKIIKGLPTVILPIYSILA